MAELEDQLRRYADQVESSVGPVMTAEVKTSPRGRIPLLLAVAALLVLIAGFAIWISGDDPESDVAGAPDLVVGGDSTTSSTAPVTPPPPLMIAVPDVAGLSQVDALEVLTSAGLSVVPDIQQEASVVPTGTVLRTDPGAGVEVEEAGRVVLVVSTGPEVVAVPDVEGLSVVDAINAFGDAGFTVAAVRLEEAHEEIEEGEVIRSEPPANALVPAGSQVSIIISTGVPKVVVPQLDGLFADTSIMTVRNAGLDPVPVFEPVPVGSAQVGRVIAQAPGAFEEVEVGSIVTITVGEAVLTATSTTTTP